MEIGGYFGLENDPERIEYHNTALRFNLARTALEYVLRSKRIRRILIPSYSCYTVKDACKKAGTEMVFYDLDERMLPEDIAMQSDDFIYITNYFGQLSNDDIIELKERYENIIVDNVQSFFQLPVDGVDTIYSCRKYFGVPDGAYLYTDSIADYEMLEYDVSAERYVNIVGRIDKSASEFYSVSRSNEETLTSLPVAKMSPSTQLIMSNINYKSVIERRRANFRILSDMLGRYNKFDVKHDGGLFFFPFYVDNGVQLRKSLISEKIFVPTLWPELTASGNAQASALTDNIVYLPIDQRYGENEMRFILQVLTRFL